MSDKNNQRIMLISCNCILHFNTLAMAAMAIGVTAHRLQECLKSRDGFVREIEGTKVYVDYDL